MTEVTVGTARGTFPLPMALVGGDDDSGLLFLLQIDDSSMVDAGFNDGDWVIVRRQHEAELGQFVVVRLGGNDVVRKLSRLKDGCLWLVAGSQTFVPVRADGVPVVGVVTAHIRTMKP